MNEKWTGIANQLAHGLRGCEPADPVTLRTVDARLAQIEKVMHRMDENARTAPEPFPNKPWPRVDFGAEDVQQIRAAVLARLP